jgi:hypothetical protein
LDYTIKNGVYVHCSNSCEHFATRRLGYQPPEKPTQTPCPPDLDLSTYFGVEVDDNLEVPDEVVAGKRRRNNVNYTETSSPPESSPKRQIRSIHFRNIEQFKVPKVDINKENSLPLTTDFSENDTKDYKQPNHTTKEHITKDDSSRSEYFAVGPVPSYGLVVDVMKAKKQL